MKIRSIFTLSPEINTILRRLSAKTGLKMSTIVEQGIKLIQNKLDNNETN